MESQGYLFHELKGKFPLFSNKARDGECYLFFLSVHQWRCCTLKTPYAFYSSWLSCHNPPNDTSALCQFEGSATAKAQPQFIRIRWQPVPVHAPPETGHCSPIVEQKQSSEAPHLLQGHSVKCDTSGVTPPCHTDFLDVDIVVWVNICCCYSAVVSFRLSRSEDENMFWCLPPARSTWEALCISSGLLNSCDRMTPYPLLSLKHQFNSQLLSLWIPTTSGIPLGT